MSFSYDWLGIEEDEPKASINEVDYMTLLRQQKSLAYHEEMIKRQQQLQLLQQQQQLLQRQIIPQSAVSLPQSHSYQQFQQQLIQQKMNQARSAIPMGIITPGMVPSALPKNEISSPGISSNLKPISGGMDNWTKGYLNFMKNIGKEVNMFPNINGKILNLKVFLHSVVDLGGFDKVILISNL